MLRVIGSAIDVGSAVIANPSGPRVKSTPTRVGRYESTAIAATVAMEATIAAAEMVDEHCGGATHASKISLKQLHGSGQDADIKFCNTQSDNCICKSGLLTAKKRNRCVGRVIPEVPVLTQYCDLYHAEQSPFKATQLGYRYLGATLRSVIVTRIASMPFGISSCLIVYQASKEHSPCFCEQPVRESA
jgi:hypothetical protein